MSETKTMYLEQRNIGKVTRKPKIFYECYAKSLFVYMVYIVSLIFYLSEFEKSLIYMWNGIWDGLPLKPYSMVCYCVLIFNRVYHWILYTSKLVFNVIFFFHILFVFNNECKIVQNWSRQILLHIWGTDFC